MSHADGRALLADAARRLTAVGVVDAGRDARRLLAHALGIAPGRLSVVLNDPVSDEAGAAFLALVARRAAREPVSHLVGRRSFYGREFRVTSDVLDPRPETEMLIEAALAAPFRQVLDLGTGSGCILLTLLAEMPGATGIGADISAPTLAVAHQNALDLGLGDRAGFRLSDWTDAIDGIFDLIVSNPPYIAAGEMATLEPEVVRYEPHLALTDGGDGLSAYRAITRAAPGHLQPGGRLMVEIGPSQADAVSAMMIGAGFVAVTVIPDLDGRDRVVSGRWPGNG